MRHRVLGRTEHRLEANVHSAIPALLGHLDGVAWQHPRVSVADDDVQAAPQFDGALDHAADAIVRTDVDVQRLGSAARRANGLNIKRSCLILDVSNEHARTVPGQAPRRGAADTHCTASNDCYLACEIWQRWNPLCIVRRL